MDEAEARRTPGGTHERAKNVLRHLHLLDRSIALPTPDDVAGLVPRRGRGAMLFDFYAPEDVREAFDRYGVSARLAARGFPHFAVELDTADPDRQTVRVRGTREGREGLLGEVFLRSGAFETAAPFAPTLRGRRVALLYIQWLRLQDPTRPFPAERPALPGQDHPGLGIGREVLAMFVGMAERLGLAGIVSCPEFAHNAVLYETQFRFFDPAAQGRFEALLEACAGLSLGELGWGVEQGRLIDDATGERVSWWREEMVRPAGTLLQDHLDSADYRRRADEARRACRWRFVRGSAP